jgi:hypothetical protein
MALPTMGGVAAMEPAVVVKVKVQVPLVTAVELK